MMNKPAKPRAPGAKPRPPHTPAQTAAVRRNWAHACIKAAHGMLRRASESLCPENQVLLAEAADKIKAVITNIDRGVL
jgi:hypothetical protein